MKAAVERLKSGPAKKPAAGRPIYQRVRDEIAFRRGMQAGASTKHGETILGDSAATRRLVERVQAAAAVT